MYCISLPYISFRFHTNVAHLSMCYCPLITDKGLQPLTALKRLKTLNLGNCKQMTNNCVQVLRGKMGKVRDFPVIQRFTLELWRSVIEWLGCSTQDQWRSVIEWLGCSTQDQWRSMIEWLGWSTQDQWRSVIEWLGCSTKDQRILGLNPSCT
jgi:hypothetical protein